MSKSLQHSIKHRAWPSESMSLSESELTCHFVSYSATLGHIKSLVFMSCQISNDFTSDTFWISAWRPSPSTCCWSSLSAVTEITLWLLQEASEKKQIRLTLVHFPKISLFSINVKLKQFKMIPIPTIKPIFEVKTVFKA